MSFPCCFSLQLLSLTSQNRPSSILLPSAQITENRRLLWQNNREFTCSQITQSCFSAILVLLLQLRKSPTYSSSVVCFIRFNFRAIFRSDFVYFCLVGPTRTNPGPMCSCGCLLFAITASMAAKQSFTPYSKPRTHTHTLTRPLPLL